MSKPSKSSVQHPPGPRARCGSATRADGAPYNTFLSWSGPRSRATATALRSWLRRVVQACVPWMSAEDIKAGKRWRRDVADLLTLEIGVICLTRENVPAPWINFEAGALSRSVPDDTRVIPYCLGLSPADYGDPLGDFNGVRADRDGTLKLVRSINSAMPRPVPDEDLVPLFRSHVARPRGRAGQDPAAREAPSEGVRGRRSRRGTSRRRPAAGRPRGAGGDPGARAE